MHSYNHDIRDMVENDKSFILATFLRGVYYGDSWFSLIPKDIFMANYKKLAEHMVNSPKVLVKIACLKDDPDVILGYSILSANTDAIHWCYCKAAFRKQGIAKSLLPKDPTTVTHLSKLGLSLMNKFPNAVFNPFYT